MKISILDQFAADAISAPAAVTGGSGKVPHVSNKKPKTPKMHKPKSIKVKSVKAVSNSHGGVTTTPPPPVV